MIPNIDYEREIYRDMFDRLVANYNFSKFVINQSCAEDFRYEWDECCLQLQYMGLSLGWLLLLQSSGGWGFSGCYVRAR